MSLKNSVTKELLFTYFEGKATSLQKQRIEDWMNEPENEEFFYECVHEWELGNLNYEADVKEAIKKFRRRISGKPNTEIEPVKVTEHSNPEYAYSPVAAPTPKRVALLFAASIVFLLGFNIWFFKDFIFYKTFQTDYGKISTITLPDGSGVTLNANSQLKIYRFGFGNLSRQVSLKGEANFKIVHTPDDQKFIVLTEGPLKVEVLGTEFNVFSRERGTKVGLYKGKVKVTYEQSAEQEKTVSMLPGELTTVDPIHKTLEVEKVLHPENFAAWQQGRFIFENTSLAEIKKILEENYGIEIRFKNSRVAEQTVSGSFKGNSVNELLQALAETLELDVIQQSNRIVISGKSSD
ncbi:anti-sigma factor [Adhaeribacter aerolatus]|uniref:Anti-sigma factor n=1 Tax=Adhaeribacter aerolatus TaxID=670289 RepID=A0A512AUJ4_9BACT|nr:FecR domain-containing protein [Adhaeribacter aerolatus]GEO03375.1 anti-sigma factor [Adhaeribacter aerolatus]